MRREDEASQLQDQETEIIIILFGQAGEDPFCLHPKWKVGEAGPKGAIELGAETVRDRQRDNNAGS